MQTGQIKRLWFSKAWNLYVDVPVYHSEEVYPGTNDVVTVEVSEYTEEVKRGLERVFKFLYGDREEWMPILEHWRRLTESKNYVCPKCGSVVGFLRISKGKVVGCDRCLRIQGYYMSDDDDL